MDRVSQEATGAIRRYSAEESSLQPMGSRQPPREYGCRHSNRPRADRTCCCPNTLLDLMIRARKCGRCQWRLRSRQIRDRWSETAVVCLSTVRQGDDVFLAILSFGILDHGYGSTNRSATHPLLHDLRNRTSEMRGLEHRRTRTLRNPLVSEVISTPLCICLPLSCTGEGEPETEGRRNRDKMSRIPCRKRADSSGLTGVEPSTDSTLTRRENQFDNRQSRPEEACFDA